MADESNTPSTPDDAENIILGEVVKTRAQEAYELKLGGKTLDQIADELGYASNTEVAHAISSQMKSEAQFLTSAGRAGILQMEMDRLDRLQQSVWPSAMMGDPRSVDAALKVMDRRIKITGLDSVDTQTQQHQVLVIGGQEQDYVNKLKELADGE